LKELKIKEKRRKKQHLLARLLKYLYKVEIMMKIRYYLMSS